MAILRDRFQSPARLRILLPVGPVLRDAAEAPRYRLLATTPAELILDNQLTQGVDARRLHRWLASGAIEVLEGRTIAKMEDPAEKAKFIAEKTDEYNKAFANPYNAASYGYIDDVIEPRNTRFRVIRAFQTLQTKKLTNPARKHSNIPL